MKSYKFLILLLCLAAGSRLQAQYGSYNPLSLKINYSVGIPTGSFRDVVGKTSFSGFGAEFMYRTGDHLSLGLETGSQAFSQTYPRDLYKASDGSDISAVLSNSVQTVPILFKGQYSFLTDKFIQPYVALGAGGNIINYKQYLGEFGNDSKTKFGFAARPEAGVFIPFRRGSSAGASLSAGYNFMPFSYNGVSNLNYVTLRGGISIPLGD